MALMQRHFNSFSIDGPASTYSCSYSIPNKPSPLYIIEPIPNPSPISTDLIPTLLFHDMKPEWRNIEDPSIPNNPNSPTSSPLSISVSKPTLLRTWLGVLPASRITSLHIDIDSTVTNTDIPSWTHLFNVLSYEATNLKHLSVYWDEKGGLGKDVEFLWALVRVRVKESIVIEGFYAKRWPGFIQRRMGVRPLQESVRRGGEEASRLRLWQEGTEGVIP